MLDIFDCPWDCDCDECELEFHEMMTEGMDDDEIEEYYDEHHADYDADVEALVTVLDYLHR